MNFPLTFAIKNNNEDKNWYHSISPLLFVKNLGFLFINSSLLHGGSINSFLYGKVILDKKKVYKYGSNVIFNIEGSGNF